MKRLVVCSDGTWQDLECSYPTNVVKIIQSIKPKSSSSEEDYIPQICCYDAGIGTSGNNILTRLVDQAIGGSTGEGIAENIQECYRFLCLNYSPGDEIYLFGFSRGAYSVRSLAGLIYKSGLLKRINVRYISQAYELYREGLEPDHPSLEEFRRKYGHTSEQFSGRVPITLIGCWDTVGSVGIPDLSEIIRGSEDEIYNQYKFLNSTQLSPIVKNAIHALAIDERRGVFSDSPMQKSEIANAQNLVQKWFPGDHGCVGGGSKEKSGLSDVALEWMIDTIQKLGLGLEFDKQAIENFNPNPLTKYEVEGKFSFSELLGKKYRKVSEDFNELHKSVIIRWQALGDDYRPENLKKHADMLNSANLIGK